MDIPHLPTDTQSGVSKVTIAINNSYPGAFNSSAFDLFNTQRNLTISATYAWKSDAGSLTIAPIAGSVTNASFVTANGIQGTISLNNSQPLLKTTTETSGTVLEFDILSTFKTILQNINDTNGIVINNQYFNYSIDFDGFPLTDSFGAPFTQIAGSFTATHNPLPIARSSQSSDITQLFDPSLAEAYSRDIQLSAFGGTDTLNFALVAPTSVGTVSIDPQTGKTNYQRNSNQLLLSDAFSFKVNDGLLDSNISRHYIQHNDALATGSGGLEAHYSPQDTIH